METPANTEFTPEAIGEIVNALQSGLSISQATNMDKNILEGLYSLGYNLYNAGNFTDADTVFQALCMYEHNETRFWMGLAGCRQANDNLQGAIDAYSMAGIASGLKNPEPFYYAATCYLRMKDNENAKGALLGLMELGDKNNPAHREILNKAQGLLDILKEKEGPDDRRN